MKSLVLLTTVCTLMTACGNDRARAADAGGDAAEDASLDGGDAGLEDGATPDADAGGGAGATLGSRWLAAVAQQSAEFCRCEAATRDYATAEECALAEGYGPEVGACADEAMRMFSDELGAGFDCIADATEQEASCFADAASCDPDTLNACEMVAGPAIGACPATAETALNGFFTAIGACVRGPAGSCPDLMATGTGVVARGSTVRMGNDLSPSCAAGADVAPDATVAWTAPATGRFRFDTFGSAFDTQLVAYSGCAAEHELACSDDEGDRRTSRIDLDVSEGDTVLLGIDGYDELSAGDFVLEVSQL